MTTSSQARSFAVPRWQVWLLQGVALVVLAACTLPAGNGGLTGAPTPNLQGIYQGSYTYGAAFSKLAGQTVTFEISLHQSRGSGKVTGVIRETDIGVGTPKDGYLWASLSGTCVSENGMTHLRFNKTYRHFKAPPLTFKGTLPPGSSLLSGTWYDPAKSSDSGMFQISGLPVQ